MAKINKFEWIVPLLILIFGAVYYLQVSSLSRPEVNLILIEPIFFILVALIGFYFVREMYQAKKNKNKTVEELDDVSNNDKNEQKSEKHISNNNESKKAIGFFLLTTLFVFTMEYIGFLIGSSIYMIALMVFLGVRSYKQIILIPILTVILLYFSFEVWLNIRLPQGFFGI